MIDGHVDARDRRAGVGVWGGGCSGFGLAARGDESRGKQEDQRSQRYERRMNEHAWEASVTS